MPPTMSAPPRMNETVLTVESIFPLDAASTLSFVHVAYSGPHAFFTSSAFPSAMRPVTVPTPTPTTPTPARPQPIARKSGGGSAASGGGGRFTWDGSGFAGVVVVGVVV